MEKHKLSFCKINKLNDSIAEVIVNDGIEVNAEMVNEYHQWIAENLSTPCGLLINKIHKYTYTFQAQIKLADLPQIQAMGVVVYTTISEISTKTLSKLPREEKWNLQMFGARADALEWLKSQFITFEVEI